MDIRQIDKIEGRIFPAGRLTRILFGPGTKEANNFVVGYTTIYPSGSIPEHKHHNEEVYVFLSGTGLMKVANEVNRISNVSAVYIPSDNLHSLVNIGNDDLHLLFIYSPAGLVDHWQHEMDNLLK